MRPLQGDIIVVKVCGLTMFSIHKKYSPPFCHAVSIPLKNQKILYLLLIQFVMQQVKLSFCQIPLLQDVLMHFHWLKKPIWVFYLKVENIHTKLFPFQ